MKRLAILSYGSAVYVLFLATFVYCALFVAGVLAPTTLDAGGPASDLWTAIAVNVGILGLFGIQHTIMARAWFKRRWTRIVHPAAERSTFVLVTCAILGLLFWQWRPIEGVIWDVAHPAARAVLWGLHAAGFGIVLVATFLIDHFGLFGLRQVVDHYRGGEPSAPPFQKRLFYKWVRHPLMTGFLIAFWAAPTMTASHLLFAAVVTAYIVVGTRIEEGELIRSHGETYLAYKREVPAFFPSPFRRAARPAARRELATQAA